METIYDRTEDGVIVDSIVASAEFVATLEGTWALRPAPTAPPAPTDEDIARTWRNQELKDTDWIIPINDHPQRATYLTYRTALRDWPSTSDFPGTKPTL